MTYKERTHELLAKLGDVVTGSRGSNRDPQSVAIPGASSSVSVVASLSLLLFGDNHSFVKLAITITNIPRMILASKEGGEPDSVEDVLRDDDDVELAMIAEDSDDDIGMNVPVGQGGPSKEEVVLSVKTYSIYRGVEYISLESNHVKYHGKCKKFEKGCICLIRITLHQRKDICEVRRYNELHTYLAIKISSDYRKLDYHVIYAFIFLMLRDDDVMLIKFKVLQNATKPNFGFRLSYRKMRLAKQKAVVHIDGNLKESHNELPRWDISR
ncbi:uncharacterized protein LOC107647129 [Arachis ipaensis]|uniref:uncharacterized protein LOC107647129 n=1 Tax=Arachis ipaensis TaxID=130454 RepID=UPI0007AFD4E1|nr:uncharacterized protein LOC107647129 [Arachis ipaensis]